MRAENHTPDEDFFFLPFFKLLNLLVVWLT